MPLTILVERGQAPQRSNAGAIRSMLSDAEKKAKEEAAGSPGIFSSAIKV